MEMGLVSESMYKFRKRITTVNDFLVEIQVEFFETSEGLSGDIFQ